MTEQKQYPLKTLRREKIWHPLTRVWHWGLALSVVTAWCLGEFMSFDTVRWHFYLGYLVIGLMLFRLIWGFVGPVHARFSTMLPSLAELRAYIPEVARRTPSGTPGHNPLGGISALLMIVVIVAQAITGLFIEADDFFESAPLAHYVSSEWAKQISGWHHQLAEFILILVGLHIAAILFYLFWKRENLITGMLSGWKQVRVTDTGKDGTRTPP